LIIIGSCLGRGSQNDEFQPRHIDQDVKLNRALWALAEKMAELKAA
jgi:hypothetical protein